MAVSITDLCELFWAFFFPPLAVFLDRGCGCQLLINCLLTLLGWIPGTIHLLTTLR